MSQLVYLFVFFHYLSGCVLQIVENWFLLLMHVNIWSSILNHTHINSLLFYRSFPFYSLFFFHPLLNECFLFPGNKSSEKKDGKRLSNPFIGWLHRTLQATNVRPYWRTDEMQSKVLTFRVIGQLVIMSFYILTNEKNVNKKSCDPTASLKYDSTASEKNNQLNSMIFALSNDDFEIARVIPHTLSLIAQFIFLS